MRGSRWFAACYAVVLTAMAACSSFTREGDASDGGADGADASTAEPESGDADATPAAPTNLLANGDFEHGCAAWSAYIGTLTEITDPALVHGGGKACQFCAAGDGGLESGVACLTSTAKLDAPKGARFYGEAWVRATPSKPAPTSFGIRIDFLFPGTATPPVDGTLTSAPALDSTWQRMSAVHDLDAVGPAQLELALRFENRGTCVIVDDAMLYRTP